MKKILGLSMGIFFVLALVIAPTAKASAAASATFSFGGTTLVRGQDNNVSLTVTNTGATGEVINIVGFGTPEGNNITIKSPAEGVGGPSIATGPWVVGYYNNIDDRTGGYNGYNGVLFAAANNLSPETGFAPIKPTTSETFNITINVPKTVALGNMNVLAMALYFNSKTGAPGSEQLVTFNVVDPAGTTVTSLPKTGADMNLAYLAILGLPAILRLRRK